MYHSEEHIARLIILLLDVLLNDVGERSVASLVALYYLAALFVDDDNVVVCVDYVNKS